MQKMVCCIFVLLFMAGVGCVESGAECVEDESGVCVYVRDGSQNANGHRIFPPVNGCPFSSHHECIFHDGGWMDENCSCRFDCTPEGLQQCADAGGSRDENCICRYDCPPHDQAACDYAGGWMDENCTCRRDCDPDDGEACVDAGGSMDENCTCIYGCSPEAREACIGRQDYFWRDDACECVSKELIPSVLIEREACEWYGFWWDPALGFCEEFRNVGVEPSVFPTPVFPSNLFMKHLIVIEPTFPIEDAPTLFIPRGADPLIVETPYEEHPFTVIWISNELVRADIDYIRESGALLCALERRIGRWGCVTLESTSEAPAPDDSAKPSTQPLEIAPIDPILDGPAISVPDGQESLVVQTPHEETPYTVIWLRDDIGRADIEYIQETKGLLCALDGLTDRWGCVKLAGSGDGEAR